MNVTDCRYVELKHDKEHTLKLMYYTNLVRQTSGMLTLEMIVIKMRQAATNKIVAIIKNEPFPHLVFNHLPQQRYFRLKLQFQLHSFHSSWSLQMLCDSSLFMWFALVFFYRLVILSFRWYKEDRTQHVSRLQRTSIMKMDGHNVKDKSSICLE